MPQETQQPFQGQPRKTDDTKLVAEVLGPDAAAEMGELAGDQPPKVEPVPTEFEMSAAEQSAAGEVEETITPDQRRRQYLEWAEGFNKNEAWVNLTFIFETDGSVKTKGGLYLFKFGVDSFPPGLVEVVASVLASNNQIQSLKEFPKTVGLHIALHDNQITSLHGLPDIVHGHLYLHGNEISSLDGISKSVGENLDISKNPVTFLDELPKIIGNNLLLIDIPATSIPVDLQIGGQIVLRNNQTDLINDCKAKGYSVKIK